MSIGKALRSPLGSHNKIETAAKAAGDATANSGAMPAATAGDSPLGVLLTVMGLQAKDPVSKRGLGDSRILEVQKSLLRPMPLPKPQCKRPMPLLHHSVYY